MTAFTLAGRCPRLALAHKQRRTELTIQREERHFVRDKLQSAERCYAHRDLQLVRALATGNPRYIRARQEKLKQAKSRLRSIQRWADQIGALA